MELLRGKNNFCIKLVLLLVMSSGVLLLFRLIVLVMVMFMKCIVLFWVMCWVSLLYLCIFCGLVVVMFI